MNGNIIDLVITRADEALLDNVVVDNWQVSDHLAVCCDLKLPPVCVDFEKIQVRKYKSIHKELFKTDLKHSFRTSDTTQCADDLAVEYNEVLSSLCDKHAPLVNIKSKGKPPKPWYSDIIHLARRKRRRVECRWKKTGLEIHRQMFLQQRESVAKLIDETKQKYYLNVLTGSAMKDMHKTVRELLNTGRKILPVSIPNNALPEEFATYFSNKIAQIRQKLAGVSRTECIIDEDLNCPAERLDKFSHVRVSNVNRILTQLAKKSCLLDPWPTWLLHHNKETILPVITKIVNTSLSSGVFPASLKCALTTPILKKPGLDFNLLSNYRPVSNLPFIGKVIEKAVAQQVSQHISNYQLWDDLQSAYRPGHSCETAMVKVTNDILLAFYQGEGVLMVMLDLSAAYDLVDHEILLSRLKGNIGLAGTVIPWFQSYLEARTQMVSIAGNQSCAMPLHTGIPQGSVLGPLLYLTYMLPVRQILGRYNYHGFADDTQIYVPFSFHNGGLKKSLNQLEQCITELREWFHHSRLMLNVNKTEFVVFTSPQNQGKIDTEKCVLTVGEKKIFPSKCVRNLGSFLDMFLHMDEHISKCPTSLT